MDDADLAHRIAGLSPERRALVQQRLASRAGGGTIGRRRRGEHSSLSFAQERLWFLEQFRPGTAIDNLATAFRLTGALDRGALEASLSELARRHEILRTTFGSRDGRPYQVVHPEPEVRLLQLDARAPDEAEQLLRQEIERPFDLTAQPLFRPVLVSWGGKEHLLGLVMHHIVSDGWSLAIMVRELSLGYGAAREHRPPALPPLPVQYADFADWQRERLRGERLTRLLDYWRAQVAGAPELLALQPHRPRPAALAYRGHVVRRRLPPEMAARLRQLAVGEGASLFIVLLAGFVALVRRWTDHRDLVLGVPVANRLWAEVEPLIGFFTNTLAIRTRVPSRATFIELVRQVRDTALGAYEHQELPFERLVDELRPGRDLSFGPIVQVVFTGQNAPAGQLRLEGVRASPAPVHNGHAKFDLTVAAAEDPDGVALTAEYDADLFDEAVIDELLDGYARLLEQVAGDPGRRLSSVQLVMPEGISGAARWVGTAAPDGPLLAHLLVWRQAREHPDAPAVSDGTRRLTYRELAAAADRLASDLQREGVGPEVPVAVLADRSIDLIVALLGVMQAGGVYVPLDPAFPDQRLSLLLADTSPRLLLLQRGLARQVPAHAPPTRLIDTDSLAPPGGTAKAQLHADNLAYVIHTSGSTGSPKGVMVSHRGLVSSTLARDIVYHDPPARMPVLSSVAFDSSIADIFWTLARGGELVLVPPGTEGDVAELARAIERGGLTHLLLLPSLHALLLAEAVPSQLASLRCVVLAGEAWPGELRRRHRERLPNAALCSEWGATECSIWSSFYEATGDETEHPLGRPIAGASILVIDRDGNPVPSGVAGEACIGGVGVSRGYLGRPDLTADRFVPDPFADQAGARLYRTGDLVRRLPSGDLQFLGRVDNQLKVRGFRVEPEEIEAALLALPGIGQAAVHAAGEGVQRRLVACVTGSPEQEPELRRALGRRLPHFMVPSEWVWMDALPVTATGKIDRARLPEPGRPPARLVAAAPAETAVELATAGVWREVLDVREVGLDDDFFTLGGHSLLAMQVVARLRRRFGIEIGVRALFETPTVRALSETIEDLLLERVEQLSDSEAERLAGELPSGPGT